MPFYHSYGLNAFCFRAFAAPCTLIVMSKWDVKLALKLIPKYAPSFTDVFSVANPSLSTSRWKVSMLPLVPSMIHQLVNSAEWAKTDTSSIETTASAAAFLPPELNVRFQSKLNSTFFQGYGSSEAVRARLFASRI